MSLPEYEISSLGFLEETCLTQLPAGWSHYQPLLDDLASSDCERMRTLVDALPSFSEELYPTQSLSRPEKKFFYAVLSMIIHKYMWGNETSKTLDTIPKELGLPFLEVSKDLGLLPILSYPGYVLYNWTLHDNSKPFSLENVKPTYLPVHTYSQEWFTMIHVGVEGTGAKALKPMMDTKKYIMEGNDAKIKELLKEIIIVMKDVSTTLMRMYEHCIPADLQKFRRYFEGTNYPNLFPKGLLVKGVEHEPIIYKKITGGQSTTIHAFDAFFSVEHEEHGKSFMDEMVLYMPPLHQKYLNDLRSPITLKDYVSKSTDSELTALYQEGIDTLTRHRTRHLEFLHKYIYAKNKDAPTETQVEEKEESSAESNELRTLLTSILRATRQTKKSVSGQEGKGQKDTETQSKDLQKQKVRKFARFDILLSLFAALIAICLTLVFPMLYQKNQERPDLASSPL